MTPVTEVELEFNQRASIQLQRDERGVAGVIVKAPVRGDRLRTSIWRRDEEPRLVDLVCAMQQEEEIEIVEPEMSRFIDAGLLVPSGTVARAVAFECTLADAASQTGATPAIAASDSSDPWIVNPSLRILDGLRPFQPASQGKSSVHEEHAAPGPQHSSGRSPLEPYAWIEEADRPWLNGYSIEPDLRDRLATSRGSMITPEQVGSNWEACVRAGLVVSEPEWTARRAAWDARCEEAAARFARHGYARMDGLLGEPQLAAVQRYYQALVQEGYCGRGDQQVSNRYVLHNEVYASFLHRHLTAFASRMAGTALKPSYVYFGSYTAGASLVPHLDREQCDYSMSFLVDYSPEPCHPSPWALFLRRPESDAEPVAVHQAPGDGLLYRGQQLLHYREPLPAGHRSTSLFFHWVPVGFTGPLD